MLDADRVRYFAQKPVSVHGGTLLTGPQRERGMWSFLTWSFFLAQLAVGNAFAGGSAQAATGIDDNTPGGTDNTAINATSAPGTLDLGAFGGEDLQSPNVPGAAAQLPVGPSAVGPDPDAIERVHLIDEVGSANRPFATLGGSVPEGGAVEPDVPAGETPDIELPPIGDIPPVVASPPVLDGLVPPILDALVPPVLDTIDDLVDGLGPILGDILVPVVETVEDLGDVLGPVIDHVLSPVENVVDDVIELIEPIGGAADQILELADPILDHVDAALPPVMDLAVAIEPVVDPILDIAAPILDVLEPIDKPILDILPLNIGGGLPMAGVDAAIDVVGTPGHLDFEVNAEPVVHELFQAGAYTEYGLAMQQTPSGTEGAAGELLIHLVEPVDAPLGDDEGAGSGPPTFFGSLQHENGLRGLGDGLM